MMRFAKVLAAVLPAAAIATSASAYADGGIYQCAPNAPGGVVMTCIPAEGIARPEANPFAPLPAQVRSLKTRTHNWLAPTGELVRAGEAEVNVHQFIYAQGAIGLSDNIELDFSVPVIPIFASVGARVGLTAPDSPLKLVVGADIYVPLFEDSGDGPHALTQATVTAGYSTDSMNVHATASVVNVPDEESALGAFSVGGSLRIGRKAAIFGELTQLVATDGNGNAEEAGIGMSTFGVKFMGENMDLDLGLMFLADLDTSSDCADDYCDSSDDDVIPAMPTLSMNYRF